MTFIYSPYRAPPGEVAEPMKFKRPPAVSSDDLNRLPIEQRLYVLFREIEDQMNDGADNIRRHAADHPAAAEYIDYLRAGAVVAGLNYSRKKPFDINHSVGIIISLTQRSAKIMREIDQWIKNREAEGQGTTD